MEKSILTSIKKLLGIDGSCTDFDQDVMIHINTVFMTLHQLGVGPNEGFRISSEKQRWSDYIEDESNLDAVKTYIYMKVKMIFDPPLNAATIEAYNNSINEFEWRLNVQAESNKEEV